MHVTVFAQTAGKDFHFTSTLKYRPAAQRVFVEFDFRSDALLVSEQPHRVQGSRLVYGRQAD